MGNGNVLFALQSFAQILMSISMNSRVSIHILRQLQIRMADEDDFHQVDVRLDMDEDQDIILELESMTDIEQSERLVHWARLGRFVMSMAQVTPGSEALSDYLNPLNAKVDDLIEIISEHKGLFTDLSVGDKGHIAERYVAAELNKAFAHKSHSFEQWSATGHQGDILGRMHMLNRPPAEVIIEVKDYVKSKQVPSKEVEKFRKDMMMNPHIEAGIFVSLHKDVATLKGPVHFEMIDNRPAIYVIQATSSEKLFVLAWGLLEAMLITGSSNGSGPSAKLLEASAERLRTAILNYESDVSSQITNIDKIESHVTELRSTADNIQNESYRLRASILERLNSLKRELMTEADDLERGDGYSSQVLIDTEESWLNKWRRTELDVAAHRLNLLNLLRWVGHLDNADEVEIIWESDGEPPVFKVSGEERISFKWTKSNLRLIIDPEYLELKPNLQNLTGFVAGKKSLGAHIDAKALSTPTLEFEAVKGLLAKK